MCAIPVLKPKVGSWNLHCSEGCYFGSMQGYSINKTVEKQNSSIVAGRVTSSMTASLSYGLLLIWSITLHSEMIMYSYSHSVYLSF